MSEIAVLTPNKPCWADLSSPDIAASKKFYSQLFGWEAGQDSGPEYGNYSMFTLRGKEVSGLASTSSEGQHPAWTPYIASKSVEDTAAAVTAAGGTVPMGPLVIQDAGSMAIIQDPTGAFLGVWQPNQFKGAAIMGETGAITWTEIQTRDIAKAAQFFKSVFGWGSISNPMGPGMPEYTEWKIGEESVAGGMPIQPGTPAEIPPFWLCYFGVDSAAQAAEQVTQLGGRVMMGPAPFPGGQFAVCADPHGAVFGVMQSDR